MITTQCPICGRAIAGESTAELPYFPFCSERCRTIDLGRWLREDYRLAAPPDTEDEEAPDDQSF